MINNYYDAIRTLGIQEEASQDQIKEAFRSLSKKYHPDLYKEDNGEAFKSINQAYQYLKKYPSAPNVKTVYHQKDQYSRTYNRQHETAERQQRTARNRARQAARNKQQKAYYEKLFHTINPYVLIVLVLNCLLAIDYFLPRIERTSTIQEAVKTHNSLINADKGILALHFETGDKVYLYNGNEFKPYFLSQQYTYTKTLIFQQQMYLYNETSQLKLDVGFNVIKVFGFIIIIQLMALWRYFASKNTSIKLNAVVVMGFFIIVQIVLLIIR